MICTLCCIEYCLHGELKNTWCNPVFLERVMERLYREGATQVRILSND